MTKFSGVGVALVTPFNEDYTIDYNSLEKLIEFIIEGGVDYFVINGTTGEASTLDEEEKAAILAFSHKKIAGRKPIMYGVGSNNTRHVFKILDKVDKSLIDGILSVAPYYNKPTQRGFLHHYEQIADYTDLPIVIYNVPGRTGANIKASTVIKLAQIENIVGIKEASGNLMQCMKIAADMPDGFELLSGDDGLTVPMISVGATGVISVIANAYPKTFTSIIHKALDGDFKASFDELKPLLPLNTSLYDEGNPVGIKEALHHLGHCRNTLRSPLVTTSRSLSDKIGSEINSLPFRA